MKVIYLLQIKIYIFLKSGNHILKLDITCITYIESMGDYAKIFSVGQKRPLITHCCLKMLEQLLSPYGFLRIHRSYIINKLYVNKIEKGNIVYIDTTCISVGDTYKKQFQYYLEEITII